mmetsp:Transcript_14602/g.34802  ORF Transcript_14602/g.34802 Transcript_14602/m.34802 type:complete len:299 (-) Transcript_14602:1022-1918(-)
MCSWLLPSLISLIAVTHVAAGEFSFPVAVSSVAQAAKSFDRGLLWFYAYAYKEGEHHFRLAAHHDAKCAMCYWGIAICRKHEAIEAGHPLTSAALPYSKTSVSLLRRNEAEEAGGEREISDLEKRLIEELHESLTQKTPGEGQQYLIAALQDLRSHHADQPAVEAEIVALLTDAMLFADAIDASLSHREQAISILRGAIPEYPHHPGAWHTYIHLTERNTTDELGLMAAQQLPSFSDGRIAHFEHMPTHISWRRGMWDEAIDANLRAIATDHAYFSQNGQGLSALYYEYHYLRERAHT